MDTLLENDSEILTQLEQEALINISKGNYDSAKQNIDEALEIEPHNLSLLKLKIDIDIKLQNLASLADDASLLIKLSPADIENHLLLAKAYELQENYENALSAVISSLEIPSLNNESIIDQIKYLAKFVLPGLYEKWQDSPPVTVYEMLGEIGVAAYENSLYSVAIKASSVALQFHHGKLGLRMRTMLTLANAHTAVSNSNLAISAYTDCFNAATDAEDLTYQIKALVSLATLYLNTNSTHMALLQYSKILDLRDKMSDEQLQLYWNSALQIALYGNMVVAYQSVGDIEKALKYGKELLIVLQSNIMEDKCSLSFYSQLSDTYATCGDLSCKLELYSDALSFYKSSFEFAKKSRDIKRKSRAYGNLGRVYAHLDNFKLSEIYLSQFILVARKTKDCSLLFDAYENSGDCMMMLRRFTTAKESYESAGRIAVDQENLRMRICALYKLGNAQTESGDIKDALKNYQVAEMHAEESNNTDFLLRIQIGMSELLRSSNQALHLETAGRYLNKIIPTLEGYIAENREEGRFNEAYLFEQLQKAYQGLQIILSKTGFNKESVEVADNLRKWSWYRFIARPHNPNSSKEVGKGPGSITSIMSSQIARFGETRAWNIVSINDMLEKQKASVLYYSLIDENIILWVFHPNKGLVRQYRSSQREKMTSLIKEFYKYDIVQMQLFGENRALPLHDSSQKLLKFKNRKLSQKSTDTGTCISSSIDDMNHYLCSLYEILITPVQDILTDLMTNCSDGEELPQLIVVPDQELFKCPFSALIDKKGRNFGDLFSLSVVSSLMILSRCLNNELDHLTVIEDNEKERESYRNIGPILDGHSDNSEPTQNHSRSSRKESKVKKTPRASMNQLGSHRNGEQPRRYVSTVTSETCTGTSVYRSSMQVVPYRQVADNDKMIAIGAPTMTKSLDYFGTIWKPGVKLSKAENELRKVEALCDARIIDCLTATKETFLTEAPSASILHIATWMCLDQGHIAFSPNPSRQQNLGENDAPLPSHYLVSADDILRLKLSARLVVLSGGFCSVSYRPHDAQNFPNTANLLASLFLLAGAECVLTVLWPVPVDVLNLFYFHFYQSLYSGNLVTQAVRDAQHALRSVPGYTDPRYWACFQLIGKDVFVDINFVRHSHLDQSVDFAEKEIWQLGSEMNSIMNEGGDPLNTPMIDTTVSDLITQKNKLQTLVAKILKTNLIYPESISAIHHQLEHCMIASQTGDPSPTQINIDDLGHHGRELLEFLYFQFLPKGPHDHIHFVMYPSRSLILVCALEAFSGLKGLLGDRGVADSLIDYLPASQDSLSFLVDLLAITKHASDLQLKVTDLSVRLLWHDPKAKQLLMKIGFSQIGLLLHFSKTDKNISSLNNLLQFCLSISSSKSPLLYQRLQVSLLGSTNQEITRHVNAVPFPIPESKRLPGLKLRTGGARTHHPVVSDPNRVVRTQNWATAQENATDMAEKAELIDKKFLVNVERLNEITLEENWDIRQINEMGKEAETTYYKAITYGSRVKVQPSFNPTDCPRIPLVRMPVMLSREADRKRKETSQKLNKSLKHLKALYQEKERKLVLPYLQQK